jgi:hypothetical protein
MRQVIWLALLVPLASPAAFAQTQTPAGSTPAPAVSTSAQLDPTNCGTPDEPKLCGPMPTRPWKHYRHSRENS